MGFLALVGLESCSGRWRRDSPRRLADARLVIPSDDEPGLARRDDALSDVARHVERVWDARAVLSGLTQNENGT